MPMVPPGRQPVGIVGDSGCDPDSPPYEAAYLVAKALAECGFAILTGGRGGVMEAASKGARDGGGLSIALLPVLDAAVANPFATIVLTTDLGRAQDPIVRAPVEISRNRVIAAASSRLVAISGSVGTANEIAFALEFGKDVYALCGAPAPSREAAHNGRFLPFDTVEEVVAAVISAGSATRF